VARMRHACEVFDDITQLDRPTWTGHPRVDELARARAQRVRPEPDRHRKHG